MATTLFHDRLVVQHSEVTLKRVWNELTRYPDPGVAGTAHATPHS